MKPSSLVLALLTLSSVASANPLIRQPVQPTQPVPGGQYAAGTRLLDRASGVGFTVPAGWVGALPHGSEVLLLQSTTRTGVVGIVMVEGRTSIEQARQLFHGPQDFGDGIVLQPVGPVRASAALVEADYGSATLVGHARGLVGAPGNGFAIVFIGPKAVSSELLRSATAALQSAVFARPVVQSHQGGVGAAAGDSEWRPWLAGKMLRLMSGYSGSGGGGTNSSTTLHLCSDGSYSFRSSGSTYGAGSSTWQDGHRGRWQVRPFNASSAELVLQSSDGQVIRHRIEYDAGSEATYLDGERVYVVPSDLCG